MSDTTEVNVALALAHEQANNSGRTQVTKEDIIIGVAQFANDEKVKLLKHFSRQLWHNDKSLSAHAKVIRELIEANEELAGKVNVGYSKTFGVFLVKESEETQESEEEPEVGVKVEA